MKTYRIQEGEIDVPEQWKDKTIQMFVLSGSGDASLVITRDLDTKTETLDKYTDLQLREAEKSLSGFRLVDRRALTLSGRLAIQIEYCWTTPQRLDLCQRQAYAEWSGYFLIVTLTARQSEIGNHDAVWQEILRSLKLRNDA